jgi:ribosome-associated translation inhibitor RaiA
MARTASTLEPSDEPERRSADPDDGPVVIRSRVELTPDVEHAIRARLDEKLGQAAGLILRGTVQFEDADGPRGRLDTRCRIKVVLERRPAVAVEERAADPQAAFERAIAQVARTLETARKQDDVAVRKRHRGRGLASGKAATSARGATRGRSAGAAYDDPADRTGSVIGRRVGRGATALKRALARPEKRRRDAYLDTSDPGVSAGDRRAGGGSTARRNTKAHPRKSRQVAALEDSRTRPSRKSTRRSATRSKQGTTKERTERGILYAPSSQTAAATARNGVPKRR